MPLSGLSFRKEKNPLSRRIQRLFEQIRADYLSARQQPKEYADEWKKAVDKLINIYSDIDELSTQLKKVIEEKDLQSSEAKDASSSTAQGIYNAIKTLRYDSDYVRDPFAKKFGKDVLEELLENKAHLALFIHSKRILGGIPAQRRPNN